MDVRVIAATNKKLEKGIAAGNFREDLYYRLNVIPSQVPPLRERAEDIPLLGDHFIAQFAAENGRRPKRMTPRGPRGPVAYHWPGNVRELRNMVERLVIMVAARAGRARRTSRRSCAGRRPRRAACARGVARCAKPAKASSANSS